MIHSFGYFLIWCNTGSTCFLKRTKISNIGNIKKNRIEALHIQLPPANSMFRLKINANEKNNAANNPMKIGRIVTPLFSIFLKKSIIEIGITSLTSSKKYRTIIDKNNSKMHIYHTRIMKFLHLTAILPRIIKKENTDN